MEFEGEDFEKLFYIPPEVIKTIIPNINVSEITDINNIKGYIPCFVSNTILFIDERIINEIEYFRKLRDSKYWKAPNKILDLTNDEINLDALIHIIREYNGEKVQYQYHHIKTLKFLQIKYDIDELSFEEKNKRYCRMLDFHIQHYYHYRGKTFSEIKKLREKLENEVVKTRNNIQLIKSHQEMIKNLIDPLMIKNLEANLVFLEKESQERNKIYLEIENELKILKEKHDFFDHEFKNLSSIKNKISSSLDTIEVYSENIEKQKKIVLENQIELGRVYDYIPVEYKKKIEENSKIITNHISDSNDPPYDFI